MSNRRTWRERLLRQDQRVPSLSDGFLPSFRVYFRGSKADAGYGTLVGDLAQLKPAGYRGPYPGQIEDSLADELLLRHNASLHDLLWPDGKEVPREQVFDMLEMLDALLRDTSPKQLHPEFVSLVNGLFDRENQPYQLRDGAIVNRHSEEQWAVVEGLEALAPDDALREILHSASADYFYARQDRRQSGLMHMALAFDAAKQRLGSSAKEAFAIVKAAAVAIPAVADAEESEDAWSGLLNNLNAITHEMVRHGSPDRPTPRIYQTTEFLFFVLAAAVRLLLSARQAQAARPEDTTEE